MQSTDHLFRREAGRMVSALTRVFGMQNLELAEDVVQEAFCRALEVWKFKGVPPNPAAWLMTTAKHCALDALRRRRTALTFAPELGRLLDSEWTLAPMVEELFSMNAIKDDLLRMMFSCCNPRLPEESQISLVLHILCGFSVSEIAGAFIHQHAAIEKRITRAKKVLAASKRLFDVTAPGDFAERLPVVQRALYLLFNEGYHGASAETAVRAELCREAMRLTAVLLEHPLGRSPATYSIAALMSLHAARLPGRLDLSGHLVSLVDQDRLLWDQELISEGLAFLEKSATGAELTEYHLEAAIAAIHARATGMEDTDWKTIVSLYDTLMALKSSPILALNRAIAVGMSEGADRGLKEIGAIVDRERILDYPFYHAALGDFELRCGRQKIAGEHFRKALALARNEVEREFLDRRANASVSTAQT